MTQPDWPRSAEASIMRFQLVGSKAEAIATVERIGRIDADSPEPCEAGDEEGAAELLRAMVTADEAGDVARSPRQKHWGRPKSKHRPAAVARPIVH